MGQVVNLQKPIGRKKIYPHHLQMVEILIGKKKDLLMLQIRPPLETMIQIIGREFCQI